MRGNRKNHLTVIRPDVFLDCTLGGFADPPTMWPADRDPRYHSVRLHRILDRLARHPARLDNGILPCLAERFGRPVNSLAVSVYHRRRKLGIFLTRTEIAVTEQEIRAALEGRQITVRERDADYWLAICEPPRLTITLPRSAIPDRLSVEDLSQRIFAEMISYSGI